MTDPTTELDERFSDPGSTPTPWAETTQVLQSAELFWISSVRADGRPHVSPLVAVWADDALHFSTGADEQKALNIANEPSVVLTTGCSTWDHGLDVMVEGAARQIAGREVLSRLAAQWAGKWDGRWRFDAVDGGFRHAGGGLAIVFAVRPTKILAFSKGRFSHTRYRFDDR